jgi:hypothetical protein
MRRTIQPKELSLRKEIENYVGAFNTPLKPVVKTMSYQELLNNVHPMVRGMFAAKLKEFNIISSALASKYVTMVGNSPQIKSWT